MSSRIIAITMGHTAPTRLEAEMHKLVEPQRPERVGSHVCTIRDRHLANAVLWALVGSAAAGAVWLVSALLAGPWLADTLAVEGTVAFVILAAPVAMARSLGTFEDARVGK